MKTMKQFLRSIAAVLGFLMLTNMQAMAANVYVSAAASLKEALNEMVDKYAITHPGVTIQKNFGASGALAGQIEQGAPADIFISASTEWIDYLMNKTLLDAKTRTDFAYNELVFAGRTTKKAGGMKDLVKLNKIAIGSPKSVPAGVYAMESMKNAGVDQNLAAKLVMAKDVRECLTYAEIGEVDGAFVYRTDAMQAKKAKILFVVPEKLHSRVVYPMALSLSGAINGDAKAFFVWMMKSSDAKSILKKYGFILM
jgi:molybdate transport system substrate-binding protein